MLIRKLTEQELKTIQDRRDFLLGLIETRKRTEKSGYYDKEKLAADVYTLWELSNYRAAIEWYETALATGHGDMGTFPASERKKQHKTTRLTKGELKKMEELLKLNREHVDAIDRILTMPLPPDQEAISSISEGLREGRRLATEQISKLEAAINGKLEASEGRSLIDDFERDKFTLEAGTRNIQSLVLKEGRPASAKVN